MTSAPLPPPPSRAVAPPRRPNSWLLGALVLLLGFSFLMNFVLFAAFAGRGGSTSDGLSEKTPSSLRKKDFPGLTYGSQKVVILRLEGTIMDGESLRKQIDRLSQDSTVKAAVLRVNSPGGTVYASDLLFHRLKKTLEEKQIPLTVSMGAICASGGYYVSMAAGAQKQTKDVIFAEPATWCGSIGVIIPHYDLSGLAEWAHIKDDSIKSHPLKGMGNPMEPMTEQEKKILTDLVMESFDTFKARVRFGRPLLSLEKLNDVATGQIFTTKQAIAAGLVDKEGFLEAAIERAVEMANLKKDQVQVVEYKSQPTLFDILGAESKAPVPNGIFEKLAVVERLLDAATPQAYYLFTGLPRAVSTAP